MNDIAIIGMAGQFPGAKNISALWENLCADKESIRFFSDDELRQAGVSESLLSQPNYIKASPVLEDIDAFDAGFFNYSRREAEILDPQQRLLLQCAWQAIENAGYSKTAFSKQKTSVFLAINSNDYADIIRYDDQIDQFTGSGVSNSIAVNRISYWFDSQGMSEPINTACSSFFVALESSAG